MTKLREVDKRYDFSLDNRQAVFIVSGLILVLMMSFLMGALFGKNLSQMSDANATTLVASSNQDDFIQGEAESVDAADQTAIEDNADESAVEDDSVPSSREEYIRRLESMKVTAGMDDKADSAPEPAAATPVLATLSDDAAPTPEPKAVPEKKKAAAKPAKAEQKKASAPTKKIAKVSVPAGSYTIQLASLPDRNDADMLVSDLRGKKYDAFLLQVSLPGKGNFYRVRVGHYSDLAQAKKALAILQRREGKYFDAWITQ